MTYADMLNVFICINSPWLRWTRSSSAATTTSPTTATTSSSTIIATSILVRRHGLVSKDLLFGQSLHHLVGGHRKSSGVIYCILIKAFDRSNNASIRRECVSIYSIDSLTLRILLSIPGALSGSKFTIILISLIAIVTALDSQFIRIFYATDLGTPGNFQFLLFVSFALFASIITIAALIHA
jgi:hypothetical protein